MPSPLTIADLPDEAACFAEAQSSPGRPASVDAIEERDRAKLVALRAAIDEGEASGLAEEGSFARVRARVGIGPR